MAMTQRLLGRDMAARAFDLLLRSLAKALMTLTTFSAFSVALFKAAWSRWRSCSLALTSSLLVLRLCVTLRGINAAGAFSNKGLVLASSVAAGKYLIMRFG